jgi:DNA topoisomerase-6 subunit B
MTSIVNPHAEITFIDPDGEKYHWPRVTERLPRKVDAIKPHPHGIELGQLQRMCRETSDSRISVFLRQNFSGVSMRAAKELCEAAELSVSTKPKSMKPDDVRALLEAFQGERTIGGKVIKLLSPPTNCLSPIEEMLIKKGLSKTIDSKFIATMTRAPTVSHGNPFQVEVGLIFGDGMAADKHVEVLRFANRVPLMYQQGGCLLTKAIESVDWRQYGLEQAGGKGVPKGPAAILVHLASTNVQFTSEAKEALSDNEFVFEETRKAMLEMGRGLRKHLEKKKKMAKTREKFELINDILPAIAAKSAAILERPVPDLAGSITKIMSAVICNETTVWNKETKQTDVSITLFNYTSRARSYSLLVNWPEKSGAEFVGNERGGRKEAMGIWGWKIETLEPGEQAVLEYSLSGLEKGDWTETEVFFRGSQDVIGATKLDEKMLVEIRRQEEVLTQSEETGAESAPDSESSFEPGVVEGDSAQTTLFGGDV